MKAMIIADNEDVIDRVSSVVKTAGYDTIVYRWLLKALDNMEEIAPHLIVVSTREYPRHWKTLAQFATMDFGGYRPQVILFTGGELPVEEMKKAEALHVRGAFSSIAVDGLDVLREILARTDDIYAGSISTERGDEGMTENKAAARLPAEEATADELTETIAAAEKAVSESDKTAATAGASAPALNAVTEEIPTVDSIITAAEVDAAPKLMAESESDASSSLQPPLMTFPCTLVFTNPLNGALVTGISRNYDGNTVEFEPDFDTPQLKEGDEIPAVSLKSGETITAFKACVLSASNPFILKLA